MKRPVRNDLLRRRGARVERRDRILIVCEGHATEPDYLRSLRHDLRAGPVVIKINDDSGVPKTLVERAVELKKEAEKDAKRNGDSNLRFDEVWCIFDVDTHPNLSAALQQAASNGINVALSNPCFELWILLHFQDQRANINSKAAGSACRKHLPRYQKHITYAELKDQYQSAVDRARALEAWQRSRDNAGGNPSTSVHTLTERLQSLGTRVLLTALDRSRK
jgi:RloB-like protein